MRRMLLPALLSFLVLPASGAWAQSRALDRGFTASVPATATAGEIAQSDLWVLQVDFKPIRIIRLELPDPATGEMREERIYYIVYRAQNKALQGPPEDETRIPVNVFDEPPGPSLLVPEFTLVSVDQEQVIAYSDVILPRAQQAIAQREMRGALQGVPLKNSVEIVQAIKPADDPANEPMYGVAIFRNVNPEIDHFRLFAGGFSNGFRQIPGPEGKPLILQREILVEFWRPGDEFGVTETEIRIQGQPRWIYRAEDAKPTEGARDTETGQLVEETPATQPAPAQPAPAQPAPAQPAPATPPAN